MTRHILRSLFAILAVAAVFAVMIADADARSRSSFGSRGTRTFSAPAPTATAPKSVQPIERTMTKPAQPGAATAARPAAAPSATGGFFNRPGILGGLAAGFIGAGLFGLLFGHGLMGGLGGIASFFGLLLQLGIVAIVAMLVWRWWQNRSQPAAAFAGGPAMRQGAADEGRSNMSFLGGFGGAAKAPAEAPVEIKPEDFDAFERLLGEVQTAYGKEDLNTLRTRVTPEMLSYYAEELAHNTSNGDINQISDVKLLQGDLAEVLERRRRRVRHRRHALFDQRSHRRSQGWPPDRAAAVRSHRAVDLPPRARRQLDLVGGAAGRRGREGRIALGIAPTKRWPGRWPGHFR